MYIYNKTKQLSNTFRQSLEIRGKVVVTEVKRDRHRDTPKEIRFEIFFIGGNLGFKNVL